MTASRSPATSSRADPRRWAIVIVIAVCQLMLVLASIVTIALPQAQEELDISESNRQWIVTVYALAFGGCCFWAAELPTLRDESVCSSSALSGSLSRPLSVASPRTQPSSSCASPPGRLRRDHGAPRTCRAPPRRRH